MEDFLPPLFQIATGLTFLCVLIIGLFRRDALKPLWGRVLAMALLPIALGFLLLSQGTRGTMSRGAELIAGAGASFFVSAVLIVVGLILASRRSPT